MRLRIRSLVAGSAAAAVACLGLAGSASAFPTYSDCPITRVNTCLDIQSQSGTLAIKDFRTEIGNSLEIRGGLDFSTSPATFIPATGTNGFIARGIPVPGGLLGIDLPGPFDDVIATAELAGVPADIHLDLATFGVSLPMKLHLTNALFGPHCYIGTNSNPISLNLATIIPGRFGPGSPGIIIDDQTSQDRTFSVPGASGCALGLGLINSVINLKLGLPSSSGNNTLTQVNDIGIAASF